MVTYRTAKMSVLTYRRLHFLFTPSVIMRQYVTWLERNFDACQSRRSIYLYILNSFGVIRCLSQCVSPKIAIFTTFLFPLGTPLGAMTLNVVRMEREFNAYKLSRRMYPSIFNSFPVIRTASAKEPFSRTAVHIFGSPGGALHAIFPMDGKTIGCLPNASQHVPIYLQ